MASRKTAHRRRRVHSSKRRKNVKSRKVMRGGRSIFNGTDNCSARVANAKSDYKKRTEIEVFTYYSKYAKDVKNKVRPCDSQVFYDNFTSKTGI
jgi:hypothetical protein